jgi:GLPGLI family protein
MRYWPKVKVENLVIDTFPKYSWVVDSVDKYFLNYKCREAYAVVAPTDTMFVLFAVDIPLPFGPGYFIGAPGLVLEGFYKKSHQYVIAKKIEKVHYEMRLPHNKN